MVGSLASNFHEGSRSEILADYLFSGWGAVTPVRRQDDHGVDLYGGLGEKRGQRTIITDYYVVQVKSTDDPWLFEGRDAVRWLVEYPLPLFLSCVDKKGGSLAIYHVTSRFYIAAMGLIPEKLELHPGQGDEGCFVNWEGGKAFSLSAPVLRVSLADLVDGTRLNALRTVFRRWVQIDRENCDLLRRGLLRFRMPASYKVNEEPLPATGEVGYASPPDKFLRRGVRALAESAQCIGGQLGRSGDRKGALLAALLLDHLQTKKSDAFDGDPRWRNRIPGDLGSIVCGGLNSCMPDVGAGHYRCAGIDTITQRLVEDLVVKKFLDGDSIQDPGDAIDKI